jgi:hypothetical protein
LKDYDPIVENSYIPYLDANNLYGWAMSRPLPTHDFRFLDDNELNLLKNGKFEQPFLVEVDFEYPKELHELHNDYPLAQERIYPGESKVQKLIPHLGKREKYVVHHVAYRQYLKYGLKTKKIHRAITFSESNWLAKYISFNTKLRQESTTDTMLKKTSLSL